MKQTTLITALFMVLFCTATSAQVVDPKNVAERQGTNRANSHIENGVNEGFNQIEEGIGSLFGKKKKKKKNNSSSNSTSSNSSNNNSSNSVAGKDPNQLLEQHGIYPPDGACDVPIPTTFMWKPIDHDGFVATGHEFYLNEKDNHDNVMVGGPRDPKFTYKDLKPNTTYWWKAVGSSKNGYMPGPGGTFTTGSGAAPAPNTMNVKWAKYDFVPGDEVIFSDGPDIMEENGEFPSRWDLASGNVEIMEADGKNAICYLSEGAIVPFMKNATDDYLPEVFTVECDMYFTPGESGRYWIKLHDEKNQSYIGKHVEVFVNGIECGNSEMRYPGTEKLPWYKNDQGGWRHISLAYTKGKLKVYMDDTRLINIPRYEGNPRGITISAEHYTGSTYQPFIKNVKIAKGGVKYYDRILNDGKIICNGIKFDVNKASLKNESMGPINKIYQLMQKQPDLKFSVEGHTDADGDDNKNMTLSEQRAKVVKDQLILMGISSDRLTSKGHGESMPIADNTSAEGKANNRRVEFVKF